MCAEVFDTYTYSDVGFEGDACPPCIVMQPPVATLQTWMDAQDRTNLVWEEQVRRTHPQIAWRLCLLLPSLPVNSLQAYSGHDEWDLQGCLDLHPALPPVTPLCARYSLILQFLVAVKTVEIQAVG